MSNRRASKLLDLGCGEGLAAWGYWRSGRFSEIVGVDIDPNMKRSYAFDFVQADMLTLDYEFLGQFDFIHASPPCQAYSYLTPQPENHPRLILPVKHMLYAAGVPHAVENVPGSALELRPNCEMNGHYFGLPSDRPRYFYLSTLAAPLRLIGKGKEAISVNGAGFVTRHKLIEAMGLAEMISSCQLKKITREGIKQGIPPAMTKAIAEMVLPSKFLIA